MEFNNKMYASPIFLNSLDSVLTSTCMYPSKNFYNLPSNVKETYFENEIPKAEPEPAQKINLDCQDLAGLATTRSFSMDPKGISQRQLKIISNLKKLQDDIAMLQNSNQNTKMSTSDFSLSNNLGHSLDIVLSVSPSNPPYFLLPIKKEFQKCTRIMMNSFIHSSITTEINHDVQQLFNDCETQGRSNFDIVITVIWKDVSKISMMVNPVKQVNIKGEVNVLRYLSRLLPSSSPLNYEAQNDVSSIGDVDYILDTIQSRLIGGNTKERASFFKFMNSKLGSSKYLQRNGNFGLCDIFAWSTIHQLGLSNENLPSNVSSWAKKLNDLHLLGLLKSSTPIKNCGTPSGLYDRVALEAFLKKNNISYQIRDHEEVFTVSAMMNCIKDMPGMHMKNLFLKDKKKNYYLLAVKFDTQVKLDVVARQVGTKELRFGDEEKMFELLGVKQGCVTIFALLNDSKHEVRPILHSKVTTTNDQFINFHPMTNSATLGVSPQDLLKFMKLTGHKPLFVDL